MACSSAEAGKKKIMAAVLANAAVFVTLFIVGVVFFRSNVDRLQAIYEDRVIPLEQLGAAEVNMLRIQAALEHFVEEPKRRAPLAESIESYLMAIDRKMEAYRKTYLVPEEEEWLRLFDRQYEKIRKSVRAGVAAKSFEPALNRSLEEVMVVLSRLISIQTEVSEKITHETSRSFLIGASAMAIGGVLSLVFTLLLLLRENRLQTERERLREEISDQNVQLVAEVVRRKRSEVALLSANQDLQKALDNIRKLQGLLPICSVCKKIRDDQGYWNQIESYIASHAEVEFSHGLCPHCAEKMYEEFRKEKGED